MPKYAKFLKEVLSNKRRLEGNEKVMLTEECSAILQRKLPQKLKDPGSFTIPCTIGDFEFDKVLCDLGASINLMPLSIFRKLGLGEVKPTTVTLQLADRSIKHPRGIIEDVLVKVDKFIFPADFIVLDMEEDREVPLILGRPFLATVVAEKFHESFPSSSLENCIVNGQIVGNFDDEEILECVNNLDALPIFEGPKISKFRELGVLNVNTTSSIKEPPKLELKELPSHLRYAFLEESSYYPVIINSSLNDLEEEKLLRVLREHRKAIRWTIDDIKGISPSICMHKILMDETYKPLVQPQRRLNPSMQEHRKIKRRPLLHVHTALLLIGECHSDCATPLPLFNVACCQFFPIWLKNILKCLWMTFLFSVLHLIIALLILLWELEVSLAMRVFIGDSSKIFRKSLNLFVNCW
ncbi:hypothetical protein UlMin_042284 [Ulmus minor]